MIGDLIRQYCEVNGISQNDFADKIGVSYQTLNHWVCDNKLPIQGKNARIGRRIAFFIGCRVDELNTYEIPPKVELPKQRYNYRCLDDTYEPDCLHCVWHKDCGDDIVYCAKPGALCVNARR